MQSLPQLGTVGFPKANLCIVTVISYKRVTDKNTCQLRLSLSLCTMVNFPNLSRSYLQIPYSNTIAFCPEQIGVD